MGRDVAAFSLTLWACISVQTPLGDLIQSRRTSQEHARPIVILAQIVRLRRIQCTENRTLHIEL